MLFSWINTCILYTDIVVLYAKRISFTMILYSQTGIPEQADEELV